MDDCQECPITSKQQQDAVIEATIKAAYLDPNAPTSLRAIASMLPQWLKADHKRVGRRLESLISTGALPQLNSTTGEDGKRRLARRIPLAQVPDDFSPRIELICGDALTELHRLPDDSADCCVTSPPYYGQMDIHDTDQIGKESNVEEYIAKLVAVFTQVRRVIRRQGTCWINIADTYRQGQSLLVPQRLALALTQHGWKLRAEIVLEKKDPAPRKHEGRPTPSHETLLLFSLNVPHYFDPEPLRTELAAITLKRWGSPRSTGAARGTVWRVPPVRHATGGHHAVMPLQVARDCVLAGSHPGSTVIDPFAGVGTTAAACTENYRHSIGIELSSYYLTIAKQRLKAAI